MPRRRTSAHACKGLTNVPFSSESPSERNSRKTRSRKRRFYETKPPKNYSGQTDRRKIPRPQRSVPKAPPLRASPGRTSPVFPRPSRLRSVFSPAARFFPPLPNARHQYTTPGGKSQRKKKGGGFFARGGERLTFRPVPATIEMSVPPLRFRPFARPRKPAEISAPDFHPRANKKPPSVRLMDEGMQGNLWTKDRSTN